MLQDDNAKEQQVSAWRNYTGVFVCAITVLAFISVGFVLMGAKIVFGIEVTPPGEWIAAMLSLASTALGFLAGQKSQISNNNQQNNSQD